MRISDWSSDVCSSDLELLLDEAKIESTLVFYGSARIPHPDQANVPVEKAQSDYDRKVAERLAAKAKYYDEARKLARTASQFPVTDDGSRNFVVCSGGGPSIMEAANRGADDVGAQSIGLKDRKSTRLNSSH